MSFFSDIFDFAKQALPAVIGYQFGGPLGAAAGGALGGAVFGDEPLKDALIGGGLGYFGGKALDGAGGFGGLLGSTGETVAWNQGGSSVLSPSSGLLGLLGGGGGGGLLSGLTGGSPLFSLLNAGANLYGGLSQRNAAGDAANQLRQGARDAISLQQQGLQKIGGNLEPYTGMGAAGAGLATDLVTNPQAQLNFIQNNPFYQSMAENAQKEIFANQAARGKLGTGGTALALQDRLLQLGESLLGNRVNQAQSLASTGLNATNNLNQQIGSTYDQMAGLTTDAASAQAAGTLGQSQAINDALQSFLTTQGQIAGINLGA